MFASCCHPELTAVNPALKPLGRLVWAQTMRQSERIRNRLCPKLDSYEGIQQAISAFDVSGRRG